MVDTVELSNQLLENVKIFGGDLESTFAQYKSLVNKVDTASKQGANIARQILAVLNTVTASEKQLQSQLQSSQEAVAINMTLQNELTSVKAILAERESQITLLNNELAGRLTQANEIRRECEKQVDQKDKQIARLRDEITGYQNQTLEERGAIEESIRQLTQERDQLKNRELEIANNIQEALNSVAAFQTELAKENQLLAQEENRLAQEHFNEMSSQREFMLKMQLLDSYKNQLAALYNAALPTMSTNPAMTT